MSLRITATIVCDTCGSEIASKPEHRFSHAPNVIWDVKRQAEQANWLTVERGRYRVQAHYCAACADKPAAPIPTAKAKS